MDVRDLSEIDNSSIAYIIDKGTLDAILCGSDSLKNSIAMLCELERVLEKGGSLIIISYGQPESRLGYLKPYDWEVQYWLVGETRYLYHCKKNNKVI